MKIYVVRHGQTDYNKNFLYQGRTDIELNDTGIMQAGETAEKLKDIKIHKIICSPMKRTTKTAEIINKYHDVEIEFDEQILERGLGKLEGEKGGIIDFSIFWDIEKNSNEYEVESIKIFFDRIYKFYDEIVTKYKSEDINVLIVTHNGVQIATNTYFNRENIKLDLLTLGVNTSEFRMYEIK